MSLLHWLAKGRRVSLEALAAWLLADLLLVLFVVGLGTELAEPMEVDASAAPTVEATPTPAPTVTPTPTPTPSPDPPGMQPDPVIVTVQADPAGLLDENRAAAKALRSRITAATADVTDRRAAMVLIWGHSPDLDRGIRLAELAGAELARARPEAFGDAVQRHLFKKRPSEGVIELEIFRYDR